MARENPFPKGTMFHIYFAIFTKKIAPSDSDVIKLIYRERGYLATMNALQSFRSRLRAGMFPRLEGECVTDLALQPRSCSTIELDKWIKDNVL